MIATDHKPLLGVPNDQDLETIENPRMLALKKKGLAQNFQSIHLTRKKKPVEQMQHPETLQVDQMIWVSEPCRRGGRCLVWGELC